MEDECLKEGTRLFGYRGTPHDLCIAGKWDLVREFWTKKKAYAGTGTSLRAPDSHLLRDGRNGTFITFAHGRLHWCRPTGPVEVLPDGNHRRATVDGWHDRSVNNTPLTSDHISGQLLKLAMFRGTICRVKPFACLLRKLNDEASPEVAAALEADRAMIDAIVHLMRLLTWQDFDLLVDLIFSASGWRRIGGVQKDRRS